MRKICIFTGTRAEYGLLRPLIAYLHNDTRCEVQLLVSGGHLATHQGMTIKEIRDDGYIPSEYAEIIMDSDSKTAICTSTGLAVIKLGECIARLKPDIIVVLGDRYEAIALAIAATILNIPLAHIHGGESTFALIDEANRHAITKMSHLHFATCEAYRRRIIQMGEQPSRVFNVGALGVENALAISPLTETEIRAQLGIDMDKPYILVTFHPVTLEHAQESMQISALTEALNAFPNHAVIFTGVNADPGANILASHISSYATAQSNRVRTFVSLGVKRYLSAARYAACVVGNSSSGVVEIPSLGVPVVNIGNRQEGRIHADSVFDCPCETQAIQHALERILTPEWLTLAKKVKNPYQPNTVEMPSESIGKVLCEISLTSIIKKKFYDINQE